MYKRLLICSLLSCFALESIKCELNKYVLQGLAIPADKVEAELEHGPTMCKWQMSYFEANNFNSFTVFYRFTVAYFLCFSYNPPTLTIVDRFFKYCYTLTNKGFI